MKNRNLKPIFITLLIGIFSFSSLTVKSQYFGRNKPDYENFQFKVMQTPHFEIYYYMENDSFMERFGQMAEKWYRVHQQVFKDTFDTRNPIILYSNHADFQQTTAIMSTIGVGTGGVTEALKNRVVMPVMESFPATNHVLGHELVHAFQYKFLIGGDSTNLNSIRNLPLWMVEGMAEYLSLGSVDPHTAMWMRDALVNDDFPSLEDMTRNPTYFPYRYGQAFWSFTTKLWGDEIIMPLFSATAKFGYELAIQRVLGYSAETFSNLWKSAMLEHYGKYIDDTTRYMPGKLLLSEKNSGSINIGPSLSPNGEYIAFMSQKDVFTIDLYIAETATGKIIKRLESRDQEQRVDDYDYIESSGSWSPDNKKFAFVTFTKGRNQLMILDVGKNISVRQVKIPGVPSLTDPAWSPDGKEILFSGLVNGQNDLYVYNLETGATQQLTEDIYTEIQPSWSSDGSKIVFVTDYLKAPQREVAIDKNYNIAILDYETRVKENIDIFVGADNLNPLFSTDNQSIYFLSNVDGFRNMYRVSLIDGSVYKLTNFVTGISGITQYSPAVSISRETGKIAYNYYTNNNYNIYLADEQEFRETSIDPGYFDQTAGTLPPLKPVTKGYVNQNLYDLAEMDAISPDTFKTVPYRAKFKLDYIGNTGVGVATSRFGTGLAGSVDLLFSDILGENMLYAALSLNGEIYDFGGQVAYMNQAGRVNWGAAISHIPYRYGSLSYRQDTLQAGEEDEQVVVDNIALNYLRMFEEKASLFAYYPFSTTNRLELGTSFSWYSYRLDRYNNYYNALGYSIGGSVDRNLDAPDGFSLQQVDIAYVDDNSFFGIASPSRGRRARLQVEKYFGEIGMYTGMVDYRRYFFLNPVTIAYRSMHYGRYGDTDNNIMYPLFVGYPWYIRGYENVSGYYNQAEESNYNIEQLFGSKIGVMNLEVRVPFTGPEQLALIKSKFLFTELTFFGDAAIAFNEIDQVSFDLDDYADPYQRVPVMSTGVSVRVNLFGAMVLEPYYAIPLPLEGTGIDGKFGLNFIPGW